MQQTRGPAQENVLTYLARAEQRDPVVRAFVGIDRRRIVDQARRIDATGHDGELAGLPIAVKDVIDVEGWPTSTLR